MPTIDQLQPVPVATDTDQVLVSQNGSARKMSRAQMLAGTQHEIAVPQYTLLGRASPGTGAPETLALGSGLSMSAGVLSATTGGFDINTLPAGAVPISTDLVPLGQNGGNVAVSYAQFLSGLPGVTNIDASNTIVKATGSTANQKMADFAANTLPKSGGQMSGPLVLAADPFLSRQATTKQYTDAAAAARIARSGDTMTGPLSLAADPTQAFHATTKQYSDSGDAACVQKTGDVMTGVLVLAADPVQALEAATKQYVDTGDTARLAKSGDAMTGVLTLATDPTLALQAATKQYVDAGDAARVQKSGDVMTGALMLAADPTAALQAATKQYVDANVAGLSVKWFGAKGDGTTDDTAAIQAALDAAAASLVSRGVFLPPTLTGYRCTTTLNIRAGINLRGAGCTPTIANGTHGVGSWLYFNHAGIGIQITQAAGAPAGTTTSGVELRGIGTIRDQPADAPGWAPNANDFDISINTGDVLIDDVMLLNPTKGIKIRQPGNGYGRISIQHLRGDPYQVGIDVDQVYDIGAWNDIHFWPFWIDSANTKSYKLANLECFIIGRLDGVHASNIFTISAKNAIRYTQTTTGIGNRHQWTNIYLDLCTNGVVFDSTLTGSMGVANPRFTNLQIMGAGGSTGYAVDFQGAACEMFVSNGYLEAWPAQAVHIGGTNNTYRHAQGRLMGFDALAGGVAAVLVNDATNRAWFDSQIRYDTPSAHALASGAGAWFQEPVLDQNGYLTETRFAADANAYFTISGTNAVWNFDANDHMNYDRTANKWTFYIGGVAKMSLDSSGNLKTSGTITSSTTP